jgi:hypothetical protein
MDRCKGGRVEGGGGGGYQDLQKRQRAGVRLEHSSQQYLVAAVAVGESAGRYYIVLQVDHSSINAAAQPATP